MKKLLIILLCLPFIGFGQLTMIPDANFEAYLEGNGMGNGIANDNYVSTANIDMINVLDISSLGIYDVTGIEAMINLNYLSCNDNFITNLNISQNIQLSVLVAWGNYLQTIDVSSNILLDSLHLAHNGLTELDISQNINLNSLWAYDNQLTCLDLRNGNNTNMLIGAFGNGGLLDCITVDDVSWSTTNWTALNNSIDPFTTFSSSNCPNCPLSTEIQEKATNKELLKVIDLLRRETKQTNQPLLYLYDDGTVEKRIVIN